jgi:T3SS (YopN, CesT) and YbjN peptide-binding chaperone 1
MQFEHEKHKEAHDLVEQYLAELFDEPYHDPENGHFYVGYGSTILEISVESYGPEDSTIQVTAYCVQGVEVTEELLLGLLELNHELPVGAFSLIGTDIFFSHSIFGRSLDRKNLLGAIAAVASVSDDYDDRIVAKYGGQTALDRIHDTGGRQRRSAASE